MQVLAALRCARRQCRRKRTHAWMKIAAYRCRRYAMRQLLPRQTFWIRVAADKCFRNILCAENIRNVLCNFVAFSLLVRRYLRAECPRHAVYNTEETWLKNTLVLSMSIRPDTCKYNKSNTMSLLYIDKKWSWLARVILFVAPVS